jgi:hypothetical protein
MNDRISEVCPCDFCPHCHAIMRDGVCPECGYAPSDTPSWDNIDNYLGLDE